MSSAPKRLQEWAEPKDGLLDWLDDDLRVDAQSPDVRRGARDEMAGHGLEANPYYWPGMSNASRLANINRAKAWVDGWTASGHWFGRFNKDAYLAQQEALAETFRQNALEELSQQREFTRLLGLDHPDPEVRKQFLNRFFRPR